MTISIFDTKTKKICAVIFAVMAAIFTATILLNSTHIAFASQLETLASNATTQINGITVQVKKVAFAIAILCVVFIAIMCMVNHDPRTLKAQCGAALVVFAGCIVIVLVAGNVTKSADSANSSSFIEIATELAGDGASGGEGGNTDQANQ